MSSPKNKNQAEKLMELFEEVANHNPKDEIDQKEQAEEYIELDLLNLPPRREVHASGKQRYSFRLKKPLIRFIFIILLLIGIAVLFYFDFGEQITNFFYIIL